MTARRRRIGWWSPLWSGASTTRRSSAWPLATYRRSERTARALKKRAARASASRRPEPVPLRRRAAQIRTTSGPQARGPGAKPRPGGCRTSRYRRWGGGSSREGVALLDALQHHHDVAEVLNCVVDSGDALAALSTTLQWRHRWHDI